MTRRREPTEFIPPRAPSQAAWDAMSPAERERVVASLPPDITEAELSPPEGDLHSQGKIDALDTLRRFFERKGRSISLATELTVYYPDARRFAPDLFAVRDVSPHPRSRWIVSLEGKGLDFVMEVHVGGDRKKDAVQNVTFYASLGIPEYFIFDRAAGRLLGYRLPAPDARVYVPVVPQAGLFSSEVLGLDLRLEQGRLRFYTSTAPLPDATEIIERLDRLVAEVSARAEEEARRAEEENRRAEEERARADEAERRLAELMEVLEQLKNR